ncbi:Trichothecene 3-O-acetyltransferase [Cytospora mali]|uniref:Trichothecene 3-O-acetyltransferase n=1 Tax=Cytospora mali TaxID=578113 RepID=A0A194VTM1_CYTMA|nr:Trichothecene 3-O-acetyltransferase [Valsa mali]
MNASSSSDPLDDFPLDILGQQERINRLYTQITLCFPVSGDTPNLQTKVDAIIDTLSQGFARLAAAFPWIAGRVVREQDEYKIRPLDPDSPPRIKTNHWESNPLLPTWDGLSRSLFPFSMLDEDLVAPCKTMVVVGEELPVLLVQANFIRGGLLLTINAQHGSMDMRGQGQVSCLFAKACRGEMFTAEEVRAGNMKRENLIPLLEEEPTDGNASAERDFRCDKDAKPVQDSSSSSSTTAVSLPVWTYLAFPSTSLSGLKSLATKTLPPDITFVSTDDVLTSFIWRAITRARHIRLQQQEQNLNPSPLLSTTLTRNVDVRSHFGLPSTYPGLVTTATSHTHPVDDLVASQDLGSIASGLRAALDRESLVHGTRARATAIGRDGDAAGRKSIAATSNPSLDVRVSSWAKEGFYDLDFGPLLGRPQVARRPRFVDGAREGLVYFLPRDRDGEIVVGVCLRGEDLERLKGDGEVRRWSRWIG